MDKLTWNEKKWQLKLLNRYPIDKLLKWYINGDMKKIVKYLSKEGLQFLSTAEGRAPSEADLRKDFQTWMANHLEDIAKNLREGTK